VGRRRRRRRRRRSLFRILIAQGGMVYSEFYTREVRFLMKRISSTKTEIKRLERCQITSNSLSGGTDRRIVLRNLRRGLGERNMKNVTAETEELFHAYWCLSSKQLGLFLTFWDQTVWRINL
jgi:hypothetical protein